MAMQCSSSKLFYAIIVAAGKGKRMGRDIPKQFLPINGKPILMHTVEKIFSCFEEVNIIICLAKENIPYWQLLCREYAFSIPVTIVEGGEERFFSVKNALDTIEEQGAVVAIHDSVRPFVSRSVVRKCMAVALEKGNAMPAITPVESVRVKIDKTGSSYAYNRDNIFLVQTPQCFRVKEIQKAYSQPYRKEFNDDASVLEAAGGEIHIVQGNRENIKITTPFDINIAETLINEYTD